MHVSFTNLIQLFLAAQLSVYVVLTFRTKRLLPFSLLMATLCVHMFANVAADTGIAQQFSSLTFAFRFLYGPLLFLAVRDMLKDAPELQIRDLYHGMPFFIAVPIASPHVLFDILGVASIAVYFTLTMRRVASVKRHSLDLVSCPSAGRIAWVNTTTSALVAISIFDITHSLGSKYFSVLNNPVMPQLTLVFLLLLFNWFALKTIRYPKAFAGFTARDLAQLQASESPPQQQLSDDETQQIETAIAQLKTRQLYLDPELRASDLADAVGIKQRLLSRGLFALTGMRFNTLVNSLRINRAKQLIAQTPDEKLNLLNISYKAGFNSKTAFNTSFKAMTGMTPSEYKNTLKSRSYSGSGTQSMG